MAKTLADLAREHPFKVAAATTSFSIFLCSCIGFFREYLLLRRFGLNVVTFAELNDFFLAGLKDLTVITMFPAAIGVFGALAWRLRKNQDESSRRLRIVTLISGGYLLAGLVAFVPLGVQTEARAIEAMRRPVVVELRSGGTLGSPESPLSVITSTEKFLFFWEPHTKQTIVAPTASITNMTFLTPQSEEPPSPRRPPDSANPPPEDEQPAEPAAA